MSEKKILRVKDLIIQAENVRFEKAEAEETVRSRKEDASEVEEERETEANRKNFREKRIDPFFWV